MSKKGFFCLLLLLICLPLLALASGLSADITQLELNAGKSQHISVSREDAAVKGGNLTWSSSDTKVAKVNKYGTITAVSAGECTITGVLKADETLTVTCSVTVRQPVKKVTASPSRVLLAPETTWQCSCKVTPDNASNPAVIWASSDEAVATVSQEGLITGVAAGTCKVTVSTTDGSNKVATIRVTVKDFDLVITDPAGMAVPTDSGPYAGALNFSAKAKGKKVKVVMNSQRTDLDLSSLTFEEFNPEDLWMIPQAAGEDTLVVTIKDYPDYFVHRETKKHYTIYVSQSAVTP